MNRMEFMAELERLLADLPDEERQAAVQYYEDYFADAGVENEEKVLRELGGPEKVAASIRADYFGTEFREEDYDRKAYMEKYGQRTRNASSQNTESASSGGQQEKASGEAHSQNGPGQEQQEQTPPRTGRGLKILLIVLIILAALPVALPVLLGLAGLAIGILCTLISFSAALVIGSVALMIAGAAVTVAGLTLIIHMLPAAFLVIGIGLLIFVVGLIATVGTVKLCMIVYPAMLRGFVNLCRRPFYGKAVP